MNFLNLKKETAGEIVKLLQRLLQVLGFSINQSELQESMFGDSTENAIRDFQRKYRLRETGKINPKTALELTRFYSLIFDGNGDPVKFKIKGKVLDTEGEPVRDARVELWALVREEKDVFLKLEDSTNGSGRFSFDFRVNDIAEILKEGIPTIFFKIYQDDELLEDTRDSVVWNPEVGRLELEIVVSDRPAEAQYWTLQGNILVDGELYSGLDIIVKSLGDDVIIGRTETDLDGNYSFPFDSKILEEKGTAHPPSIYIEAHADDKGLLYSAKNQAIEDAPPGNYSINLDIRLNGEQEDPNRVSGYVYTPKRVGASGLMVKAIQKKFREEVELGSVQSDAKGFYTISYNAVRGEYPDLFIKVYNHQILIATSPIRYKAGKEETINVLLPAEGVTEVNEYEKITRIMRAEAGDVPFRELQENEEQQDITYLANKTGWDARLVAMVALADQYSDKTGVAAPYYYSLFRAGLSTKERGINELDANTVAKVWQAAAEKNIIAPELQDEIGENLDRYNDKSAEFLLDDDSAAGISNFRGMLNLTLDDEDQQKAFVDIYANTKGDTDQLWQAVKAEFGTDTAARLQLDGKLGLLTINNAPLIAKLRRDGLVNANPIELVGAGLYNADAWGAVMNDIDIPEDFPGEDAAERQENYTQYMAGQLRVSYPTAVLAEQVANDEIPLINGATKAGVTQFFRDHKDNWEFGRTPLDSYVRDAEIALDPEDRKSILSLQRTYQMTPSDQGMQVLMAAGIDSAYKVVQYGKAEFLGRYGADLGIDQAEMIFAKSEQIYSTVLNVATGYLANKRNPNIRTIAGDTAPPASDVIAYATLEQLFGEMDFCACDHCRSVLSPAAYLVELLTFIDRSPSDEDAADGKLNALDVLLERRPDIQHIQLTCENTNTVLPYIDLVNEILEHFVVHAHQAGVDISDEDFRPLETFKGYNMNDTITTEELLANPQFVKAEAYEILKRQIFPLNLPFNQPLEALRRLFKELEVPLHAALTTLRPDDDLDSWRPIYLEHLGLSQEEHQLLTSNEFTYTDEQGNEQVYDAVAEFYGEEKEVDLNAVLKEGNTYAKKLTKKLGLSYKELTALLKTQFINSGAGIIPDLERLHIGIAYIVDFFERAVTEEDFDQSLPEDFDLEPYGGNVRSWLVDRREIIEKMIFLFDPDGGVDECSFVQLELQYTNGDEISDLDYIKLLRFVRLWRKLGWTMEQTDKAVIALVSDIGTIDNEGDLNTAFERLIISLSHLHRVMKLLKINPERDLFRALALFADIDTFGHGPLYRRLFLNTTISKIDPVFEPDGNGDYLTDGADMVMDHVPAVLAACNLSAENLELLVKKLASENGLASVDDIVLNLTNVSYLYRYSYLSRLLRMSIKEVLILEGLSQVAPFTPLSEVQPNLIRYIELAQKLKKAKVKLPSLTYYLRHEDLSGDASPTEEDMMTLARKIKNELQRIELENSVVDDPTGEATRVKMALLYEQEVVDHFFNLLNRTAVFEEAEYDHHQDNLEQELISASTRLRYNDFRKVLSFEGVMLESELKIIKQAVENTIGDQADRDSFLTAIESLFDQGRNELKDFFESYSELQAPYTAFIENGNFDQLLNALLTNYRERAKNLAVRQLLADALGLELDMVSALLDDKKVLSAISDGSHAIIYDFIGLESNGVTAVYRQTNGSTQTVMLENVNTRLDGHAIPDAQPLSSISYDFYIESAEISFYKFRLSSNNGVTVGFLLDGEIIKGEVTDGVWVNTDRIAFGANRYHHIVVHLENPGGLAMLNWMSDNGSGGYTGIADELLYPGQSAQTFQRVYLRFLKAVALTELLDLRAEEITYFGKEYQIADKGFLNALPLTYQANALELLEVVKELITYNDIKEALDADIEDLLAVLADPEATYLDSEDNEQSLLLKLTDWNQTSLKTLLDHLGLSQDDLSEVSHLERIWKAYDLLSETKLSAELMLAITTNDPNAQTVANLEQAIRIRYDIAGWSKVITPINDELRNIQRDALVTYVLRLLQENENTKSVDTADKLFEYFLIDVQMDACMKTSRIKQALSTVQLFINRCLINLEPRVSSTYINSKQWEWMKRYRVWEANRKVFLYPENWIEPELRDNKSPFFKDLESELLQSDITEDAAHVALLNYLEKLDEVAKLEICGMYLDEKDVKRDGAYYGADDVLHVIGRTSGMNRKYYYRRYEYGYWTPWEKIDLDIEDNPILPVVWKGRLFLFWLNVMQKGPENSTNNITKNQDSDRLDRADISEQTLDDKITIEANLSWSEYYNGKWQPRRTSDFEKPAILGKFSRLSKNLLNLGSISGENDALFIRVGYGGYESKYFKLYNKYSLPEVKYPPVDSSVPSRSRTFVSHTPSLSIEYGDKLVIDYELPYYFDADSATHQELLIYNQILNQEFFTHAILNNAIYRDIVRPNHDVSNIFEEAFFLQNKRHVFFVTPTESLASIPKYGGYGFFGFVGKSVEVNEALLPAWQREAEIVFDPKRGVSEDLILKASIRQKSEDSLFLPEQKRPWVDSPLQHAWQQEKTVDFRGVKIGALNSINIASTTEE